MNGEEKDTEKISGNMHKHFWKHYSPKITIFEKGQKIDILYLLICFVAGTILLFIGAVSSGGISAFFTMFSIISFIGAFVFYSHWKNKESEKKYTVNLLEKARYLINYASNRERAKDYDSAIETWEELGQIKEAARVRTLKAEQGSVKVAQNVVQGDQVTNTEIKDSVLNRSNVGGGTSKAEELREAKSLFEEGLIDDDEFKQMKKEILGK